MLIEFEGPGPPRQCSGIYILNHSLRLVYIGSSVDLLRAIRITKVDWDKAILIIGENFRYPELMAEALKLALMPAQNSPCPFPHKGIFIAEREPRFRTGADLNRLARERTMGK